MSVFEIKSDNFYLDGKPFQVISGSIHYFRVMPEYWRDQEQNKDGDVIHVCCSFPTSDIEITLTP